MPQDRNHARQRALKPWLSRPPRQSPPNDTLPSFCQNNMGRALVRASGIWAMCPKRQPPCRSACTTSRLARWLLFAAVAMIESCPAPVLALPLATSHNSITSGRVEEPLERCPKSASTFRWVVSLGEAASQHCPSGWAGMRFADERKPSMLLLEWEYLLLRLTYSQGPR